MFSEDINFINSYASLTLKKENDDKKNINNLIEQVKELIKLLENEKLKDDTKIKINDISLLVNKLML